MTDPRGVDPQVAGDAALTEWLRAAVPPAKPGTATWAALREGGAHLVVHDPSVPRSPGGTGERLGLTWWVAVPIETADGRPAALWGLGGRSGGRPVASADVVRALADGARANLAQEAGRVELRPAGGGTRRVSPATDHAPPAPGALTGSSAGPRRSGGR